MSQIASCNGVPGTGRHETHTTKKQKKGRHTGNRSQKDEKSAQRGPAGQPSWHVRAHAPPCGREFRGETVHACCGPEQGQGVLNEDLIEQVLDAGDVEFSAKIAEEALQQRRIQEELEAELGKELQPNHSGLQSWT